MRSVPLVTSSLFVAALALLTSGYAGSWSSAHGNLASLQAGLFSACVQQHNPWLPAAVFARARAPACFELSRSTTPGLGISPRLYSLLVAVRILGATAIAAASVGSAAACILLALGVYKKQWAVVPLVCAPLTLVCQVLAISLYGGVHANSYASTHSDFSHAALGAGWTSSLIGCILAFAAMVPSIVDVSLPDKTRFGGVQRVSQAGAQTGAAAAAAATKLSRAAAATLKDGAAAVAAAVQQQPQPQQQHAAGADRVVDSADAFPPLGSYRGKQHGGGGGVVGAAAQAQAQQQAQRKQKQQQANKAEQGGMAAAVVAPAPHAEGFGKPRRDSEPTEPTAHAALEAT